MERRNTPAVRIIIIIAAVAVVGGVILFAANSRDATLVFRLQDAVSRSWVWDADVAIQDRSMKLYYQSDRAPRPLAFTRLEPGTHELLITAPNYDERRVTVDLRPGTNELVEPIELAGRRIPGLSHFALSPRLDNGDLVIQIRPISQEGTAIINHPALDLLLGIRVSRQTDGEGERARGEVLFEGLVDWTWDALPESTFRYVARLPGASVSASRLNGRLVLDSVVILENPAAPSPRETDGLEAAAALLESGDADIASIRDQVDDLAGVRVFFPPTIWSVQWR